MKTILLLTLLLISVNIINASESLKAEIDKTAPNFTLKDSYGKTHNLSDYKGKYVVLEWINYGCPFVKKHYDSKNMQSLQKEYTEKGVVWLSICSSAEGKEGNYSNNEINKRSKDYGLVSTAYLIDESGIVGKMYGAKSTPHMFIVDPTGNLAYAGGIDDKTTPDQEDIKIAKNFIKVNLDAGLAGKPFPVKTSKPYGCSVKYK